MCTMTYCNWFQSQIKKHQINSTLTTVNLFLLIVNVQQHPYVAEICSILYYWNRWLHIGANIKITTPPAPAAVVSRGLQRLMDGRLQRNNSHGFSIARSRS